MGTMEDRDIEITISHHTYFNKNEITNHILFPAIVLPDNFIDYCYRIYEGDFSLLYIQDIKDIIGNLKVLLENIKKDYCKKEKQIYSIADWWYCESNNNKRVSSNQIVQKLDPYSLFYIDRIEEYNNISKGFLYPSIQSHHSYQVNVPRTKILKMFDNWKYKVARTEICKIFMILILFKEEFTDLEYFP